jgi:hypothetical protein
MLLSITSLIQRWILSKIQVFWDVMLHHYSNSFRHSEGLHCLYLQSSAVPEDLNLQKHHYENLKPCLNFVINHSQYISADSRVLYLLLAYLNSTCFCVPKTSNRYINTDDSTLFCRTVLSFISMSRMKKSFSSSLSLMQQCKIFSHGNNLVFMLKIRFWIQISSFHVIFKTRVSSVACLLYNLPFFTLSPYNAESNEFR